MEQNRKYHQMMDEFIMGQLSDTERKDFESELQSNKEFASEFQLHRDVVLGIRAAGNRELKNELKNIHRQVVKPTAKIRPMWYRFAAAASVLLLVAASVWFLAQTNKSEDVFADYYEPYKISLTERGVNITELNNGEAIKMAEQLKAAENAYYNQDFNKAIFLMEGILENEYNSQVALACGISYLENDLFEKAIEKFKILIDKNDQYLKDQAVWYSSMTMLKWNKKKEAISYLEILAADTNADKHRDAKIILENLK